MHGLRYGIMLKYQRLRILKYQFFSTCKNVVGTPIINQPVQLVGKGTIKFHGMVTLGCYPSPYFLNGYIYLEAREPDSIIEIGDGVWINNNTTLISAGPGIFIGSKTTLGTNCEIIDSDFHDMHPDRRITGVPKTGKVVIGENVFVASNVKILKGVEIGNNSIIANGSVVTRSVPENVAVCGNPAKVVQRFEAE
ncbi:MAG TPA: acyltransferase [Verrucomicrobiae bacterium]|jgi:acetyltransferase-like isoleucine patch superfamily enzyme|nr:acyltransferase [Verrucomicrobiae bacterium]